jgi:hypothetical protein
MKTNDFFAARKDKRHAPRRTSDNSAWIKIGGIAIRPCVIADVSASGIRLIVDGSVTVPKEFELMTARNAHAGRKCQIKWRNGTQLGAAFLAAWSGFPLS